MSLFYPNRRSFLAQASAAGFSLAATQSLLRAADQQSFEFRWLVASCLYGYKPLEEIVPELPKMNAYALDVWPKVHGNQREQLDAMGEASFTQLLKQHNVKLGCITQYQLGPFRLQPEFQVAQRLGADTIVTGASGPVGLQGSDLKRAVSDFVEKVKPHVAAAEQHGVTIAIENHVNNLIESPDSLKMLAELATSPNLKIALAPNHLPQDPKRLASLIRDLGPKIQVFYAWQHGNGSHTAQPKEKELLQMPGRGPLDFGPLVEALASFKYNGWTEIFMHSYPRGTSMLEKSSDITTEMNKSRDYLNKLIPNP